MVALPSNLGSKMVLFVNVLVRQFRHLFRQCSTPSVDFKNTLGGVSRNVAHNTDSIICTSIVTLVHGFIWQCSSPSRDISRKLWEGLGKCQSSPLSNSGSKIVLFVNAHQWRHSFRQFSPPSYCTVSLFIVGEAEEMVVSPIQRLRLKMVLVMVLRQCRRSFRWCLLPFAMDLKICLKCLPPTLRVLPF